MCPIFFRFAELSVPSHKVTYFLAVVSCFLLCTHLDREQKLGIGAVRIALASVVLYFVAHWGAEGFHSLILWLHGAAPQPGAESFYGGLIAVAAAIPLVARLYGVSVTALYDLAALALCLGGVFGRLGCFLAGCCMGSVANLRFLGAVRYPIYYSIDASPTLMDLAFGFGWSEFGTLFGRGIPLYPAPLYYSVGWGLIFVYLFCRRRDITERPGHITCMVLVLHALLRMSVELIRDNPPYLMPFINNAIIVSVCTILVAAAIMARRNRMACDAAPKPGT
jgi:prolipoprotein diacylglyceryltransferase